MKKASLIAGVASVAAVAAILWSMPAAADTDTFAREAHDKWPGSDKYEPRNNNYNNNGTSDPTGVPEPAMLALFALGLGGLGLSALSRRRAKA